MRACWACLCAVGLLLIAAAFAPDGMCRVTLTLTDAETGRPLPGVVRITRIEGDQRLVLKPSGLDSRGWGLLAKQPDIADWFVVPQVTTVDLPRQAVTLEAFSGLETRIVKVELDLSNGDSRRVDSAEAIPQISRRRLVFGQHAPALDEADSRGVRPLLARLSGGRWFGCAVRLASETSRRGSGLHHEPVPDWSAQVLGDARRAGLQRRRASAQLRCRR